MLSGYLFIIAAGSCWGFVGIFSSIAFSEGVAPMEVAFWRALFAWFLFGSQAFVQKETKMQVRDLPLLVVFGLLGISLFYISYLYAIDSGGAALASVLMYTAPAWVVVCSLFIYKEKLTVPKIVALVLIVGGVFLISNTGGNTNSTKALSALAIISGLTSGFCYSLYYTLGKHFSSRYSSANLFLYMLPIGCLGILPFVEFTQKTALAWFAIFCIASLSTFIANQCYYQGLKKLEAGKASIVATIEPVIAATAAFFIFGEHFAPLGYLGAMLVICAVILTIIKK
jgi:DME family drug/metabolite transporter